MVQVALDTSLDEWIPFILGVSLLLFFLKRGKIFGAVIALLVTSNYILTPPLWGIEATMMLALSGIMLEAISTWVQHRKEDAGISGRRRRE